MKWHEVSALVRADVIEMSHRAKTAHLASALSCVDILTVLYTSIMELNHNSDRKQHYDKFILSKGHAATALYAILSYKGIINRKNLLNYGKKGSLLEEHPSPKQIGVEAATGSLGHGLPIANGMALANKIREINSRVFVLMSDGECNEGSVWEAAMFAAQHELQNLTAIVDYNKWQATGRSEEVLKLKPLAEKWRSFGWDVMEVDGHVHQELFDGMTKKHDTTKPRMILAHTVKGKGVSFMEDDNNWHYRTPTEDELKAAKIELGVS